MSEREFVNSLFGGASDGFFRSSSVQLPLYCGPGQHHGASGTFAGGIPVPNPCLALTSPAIIGGRYFIPMSTGFYFCIS